MHLADDAPGVVKSVLKLVGRQQAEVRTTAATGKARNMTCALQCECYIRLLEERCTDLELATVRCQSAISGTGLRSAFYR